MWPVWRTDRYRTAGCGCGWVVVPRAGHIQACKRSGFHMAWFLISRRLSRPRWVVRLTAVGPACRKSRRSRCGRMRIASAMLHKRRDCSRKDVPSLKKQSQLRKRRRKRRSDWEQPCTQQGRFSCPSVKYVVKYWQVGVDKTAVPLQRSAKASRTCTCEVRLE